MTSKRKTLIEGEWTLPEFEYLAGNAWTFTEKVDGTNIRVIFKDSGVTFGGRTEDAQIPAKLVERLNERFLPMVAKLGEVFVDGAAVLYGEGYGAKIQKGGATTALIKTSCCLMSASARGGYNAPTLKTWRRNWVLMLCR